MHKDKEIEELKEEIVRKRKNYIEEIEKRNKMISDYEHELAMMGVKLGKMIKENDDVLFEVYKQTNELTFDVGMTLTEDERWKIQYLMDKLSSADGVKYNGRFKLEYIHTSYGTKIDLVDTSTGEGFDIRGVEKGVKKH